MDIKYTVESAEQKNVFAAACWGHCCDHGGYGNANW